MQRVGSVETSTKITRRNWMDPVQAGVAAQSIVWARVGQSRVAWLGSSLTIMVLVTTRLMVQPLVKGG